LQRDTSQNSFMCMLRMLTRGMFTFCKKFHFSNSPKVGQDQVRLTHFYGSPSSPVQCSCLGKKSSIRSASAVHLQKALAKLAARFTEDDGEPIFWVKTRPVCWNDLVQQDNFPKRWRAFTSFWQRNKVVFQV
jgi:hypothetical protein